MLGYGQFLAQLEAGIAAHHAGMVPAFKEAVEACFVEGLIKVVFATETLAVGINMPARTVVIEKLTKFTGDHHEMLTPGEYTQLTGRAGRRGIDDEGHAVVLWSPFVPFEQVAALAASRTFHLRSAFRPTYNMAANLVGTYTSEQAHHLLNLSFAQYQADRDVVRLEARLERVRANLADGREQAESPYGDIWDYRRSLDEIRAAAPGPRRPRGRRHGPAAPRRGRHAAKGRYRGPVAVVASAHRKGGMRLTTVTKRADLLLLTRRRLRRRPAAGRHGPPADGVQPEPRRVPPRRRPGARQRQAAAPGPADRPAPIDRVPTRSSPIPTSASGCGPPGRPSGSSASWSTSPAASTGTASRWPASSTACSTCSTGAATSTPTAWALTARGEVLARVFHESDLLVAECLLAGPLDGLDAATLAGLLSVFVYEHRSPEPPPPPWFPSADARDRWRRIAATSEDLAADERSTGLAEHRPPDPGFVAAAHAWVAGEGLAEVVADEESPAATSCGR